MVPTKARQSDDLHLKKSYSTSDQLVQVVDVSLVVLVVVEIQGTRRDGGRNTLLNGVLELRQRVCLTLFTKKRVSLMGS